MIARFCIPCKCFPISLMSHFGFISVPSGKSQWRIKVRKMAKIRKRYNQVPHLTQDTTCEINKDTINITNNSQEVSPFQAGDHKAAMNRRESMTNTRHKNTNDPQKKYHLGMVSENILLECLNLFHGANLTLSSDVGQDYIEVWFA